MGFDLGAELAAVRGQGYDLHSRYLNPQLPRTLHAIGFDKIYERGEGAYLYDAEGNAYADFLAGFGVFAAGRSHPVIRKALHDALEADFASWTQFDCPPISGLLAQRLLAKAPGLDRVFFCNSGTEAVESALKFARHATGRGRVVYAVHAFHGLTAGSLSVNGAEEFRKGFGPLLPGTQIPLGDLGALDAELRKGDVAAMIVEPVQGHGVLMTPPGFLAAAAALLRKNGALLICDEVQSGFGRTGTFFSYQHEEDVRPDIVTVAKALSGGYVPVAAMLATEKVFGSVYSSMDRVMVHSATFKGGPLAMAAGLATLSVIDDEGLVENAARVGAALRSALEGLAGTYDVIADVRGRGLMIGIEFGRPSSVRARAGWAMLQKARVGLFAQMVVVALFQRHRILTQVSGDHMEVIKLIPPLMIGDAEVALFTEALDDVLKDASKGSGLMWDFGRTLIKQAVRS
ncbi:aspartate aminotransferase family protein [Trebonia sp.]|uniref:aspartate aminotransferase family protein n=1 Tax=Trebonia sp. TaxID=2767075 RepID=UPI002639ACA8|nr:aspartate aminotransferase family protein [Trebonia sp.]